MTKPGRSSTARWARARQARQRDVTRVNQWLNPLKGGTGSNLVDGAGQQCALIRTYMVSDSVTDCLRRWGGSPSADGPAKGRRACSSPRTGKPSTWRRGPASSQSMRWNARRTLVNTGAPARWPNTFEARVRVLGIQTKLHQWSTDDADRRFDDLFNLVGDPAFLVVAWDRVRGNRGARSAGVDGVVPRSVVFGDAMLHGLRAQLKARSFEPLPVKERMIPKASGKFRRLGIPAVRDRIVQASLKLVLEPIFEAGFRPCSYGFRPRRRPHDAIAEIHMLASNRYHWVLEGDIEACFDNISHPALMDRIRARVGDKRVLGLIKAFLCAGILSEDGVTRDTKMGTPQGGILSPLLANIALSVLDDHFVEVWQRDMATRTQRESRRNRGGATYRLIRYADDFVVMVAGTEAHAEVLRGGGGQRCSRRWVYACRSTRR